jgi:hypothetical protein
MSDQNNDPSRRKFVKMGISGLATVPVSAWLLNSAHADMNMDLRDFLDDALARGEKLIRVPAGTHTLSTYQIPSGVTLLGPGAERCSIRRDPAGSRILFDCRGQSKIGFRGLTIDIASNQNFSTHIHADNVHGLNVRFCRFIDTTTEVNEGWTTHAVLARFGSGVRLVDNATDNCQFKTGGADVVVARNHFRTSRNFAVSWVFSGGQVGGWARITRNLCQGFWAGGIYVGSDGDTDVGSSFKSVYISRNTVIVEPEPGTGFIHPIRPHGILVRVGESAETIVVSNNVVRGGPVNSARPVVHLKRTDTDAHIVQNVAVTDNFVDPETAAPYLARGTLPYRTLLEPEHYIEERNSWQTC